MFSSKKDLEALLIAGPIVLVGIFLLYFAGIRVFLTENAIEKMLAMLTQLNHSLMLTTLVDGIMLLFLFLFTALVRKMFH